MSKNENRRRIRGGRFQPRSPDLSSSVNAHSDLPQALTVCNPTFPRVFRARSLNPLHWQALPTQHFVPFDESASQDRFGDLLGSSEMTMAVS
ncbi:hypothetical protein MRX96_020379 [Rhipicephalus microplus]